MLRDRRRTLWMENTWEARQNQRASQREALIQERVRCRLWVSLRRKTALGRAHPPIGLL